MSGIRLELLQKKVRDACKSTEDADKLVKFLVLQDQIIKGLTAEKAHLKQQVRELSEKVTDQTTMLPDDDDDL